jgi:hypothetical protein
LVAPDFSGPKSGFYAETAGSHQRYAAIARKHRQDLMNPLSFQDTLPRFQRIGSALLLASAALLAGCVTPATTPATARQSSSQVTPGASLEIRSMMVLAPGSVYTTTGQHSPLVGSDTVERDAQYLVNALSARLNVAGYDTISMPQTPMGMPLSQLLDQRLKTSNTGSAMVISIRKMSFTGGLPTRMELSVSLLDTATKQKLWTYEGNLSADIQTEKNRSGTATTRSSNLLGVALEDVFSRFRADKFVPASK